MMIQSIKLVCFSPIGTTKSLVRGIAAGIDLNVVELIDITDPKTRKQSLVISENELLVIGVPVYMGRVPALVTEWITLLQSQNTPTIRVVAYGNRAYENALLKLKDIVIKQGGVPIAAGAFIGEHSFSNQELPTAAGRPDSNNFDKLKLFGEKIKEKISTAPYAAQIREISIPGTYPYGGTTKLWDVDFIEVNSNYSNCGVCVKKCPVGAIDSNNSGLIDKFKCISCCACIKSCPKEARSIKPGPVWDAAKRLNTLYKERKEPEMFF